MDPTAEFTEAVQRAVIHPQTVELDRLALLVAAHDSPLVEPDVECARLDQLASDFGGGTASDLMAWLAVRGFRGNAEDYYHPDNSMLNRVMDRGLGIPISLSVVAIEVGRRSGIELDGVGLPGEFIVAERNQPDRFHNPYRQRSMSTDEVLAMVRRFAGRDAQLTPAMLQPVDGLSIIRRMLTNLAHIYSHTDRPTDLEWVLRLQTRLPGMDPAVLRQFAAVLARLGRFWEASDVLTQLIESTENDLDLHGREEIDGDRAALRHLQARLN